MIFIVNFVTCYLRPAPDTPTQTAILPPFYGTSPAPHIHAAGSLHASLPHRTVVVLPPYPRPAFARLCGVDALHWPREYRQWEIPAPWHCASSRGVIASVSVRRCAACRSSSSLYASSVQTTLQRSETRRNFLLIHRQSLKVPPVASAGMPHTRSDIRRIPCPGG